MKRWTWLAVGVLGMGSAACGDDGGRGRLADAPLPTDGQSPEQPAPPAVTVTVTLLGAPAAGQTVYFQSADSMLVREAKTASDGTASAQLDLGGFVTVIEPDPPQAGSGALRTRLATFAGVKPGDALHLDVAAPGTAGAQVKFDVSVPNEQLGNDYSLFSSCGQAFLGRGNSPLRGPGGARANAVVAVPVTQSVTLSGCSGTADLLVTSSDASGNLTGWQYKAGVAVADGVPVSFTDAYQAPVDTTFHYTQVSATSTGLTAQRELRTARGSLYVSPRVQAASSGAEASVTIAMPAPAGAQAVTTSIDQPTSGHGRQTIVEWGPAGASYDLAYGDVALSSFTTLPAVDAAGHAITWTEQAGRAADFVLATYSGSRTDQTGVHAWTWRIVAPYAAGQARLVYPVLPTTLYDVNPRADDQLTVDRLTTADVPAAYDAVRALALNLDVPASRIGAAGKTIYEDVFSPPVASVAPVGRPGLFHRLLACRGCAPPPR